MIAPIVRSSLLVALFVGAVTAPAFAQAQASTEATPIVAAPLATPTVVSPIPASTSGAAMAPVGVTGKMQLAPVNITSNLSTGENVGTNRAMMGAGIAAVLIGLIVGGDVGTLIAVGGAVFALVGLYRYMK